jgi:hypothetical protein
MSDQQMKTWSDITHDLLVDAAMGNIQFISPKVHSLFTQLKEYFDSHDIYLDEDGCERKSLYGDRINDYIIGELLDCPALFHRKGSYWHVQEIEGTDGLCDYVRVYTMNDGFNMTNEQLWQAAAEIVTNSADAKNIFLNEDIISHLNTVKAGVNDNIENFEKAKAALKDATYHFSDLNNVRWKLYEFMGDVFFVKHCDDMESGEWIYVRYSYTEGFYFSYERPLKEIDFNNVI